MNNPRHIFKISQRNYIVRKFFESWQHGALHWDEMLLDLANFLEKRCNDLVDENGMRSQILADKFPSLPFPVLESSLVPDLSGVKHPLERQSKLISAIIEIEYIYQNLLKSVERKIKFDTGRLHSSYSCEAVWAIKTEEQIESINDEVTIWTRRVERMEIVNYQIYMGDPSCKFNARSHLVQCAINPLGRCAECPHYEKNI